MQRTASKEAWRDLLASRNLSQALVSAWSDLARPNVRLVPGATQTEDETRVGVSKLGGLPDLPLGDTWPTRPAYDYAEERRDHIWSSAWRPGPLSFLAQINLAEIARHGCDLPLPDAGLLLFFYDAEVQPWGFDPCDSPGTRVLFIGAETPIRRCSNPPIRPSPVRPLQCEPSEGLPSWECMLERMEAAPDFSRERFFGDLDKLSEEDRNIVSYGGHAFAGWPALVQGPMELECEIVTNGICAGGSEGYADPRVSELRKNAEEWRLLLQLDSDDQLNWMWGDVGRLYFWCRERDIAARRFECCWTILQCG